MENEKMKNPMEMEDDTLDTVSGGTIIYLNNLESDSIKEETMLIIPIQ